MTTTLPLAIRLVPSPQDDDEPGLTPGDVMRMQAATDEAIRAAKRGIEDNLNLRMRYRLRHCNYNART